MSKIIGVENTERINAELEKLIEEVKKRTKTTITGVRIPDLGEAQTIDGSEMIIVEGKAGTQRTLVTNIPNQEVIDSRGGEQTLGDRLDKIDASVNDNTNNIIANANAINVANKEVIDARTDNQVPSNTYPTLKDRLDAMGATTTIANQALTLATTVNQEVVQARNGEANLKTRIDNIATLANENKTNITNLTASNNDLKQEIINARSGKNNLKEKIDEMVNATTTAQNGVDANRVDITNLTVKHDALNQEVINARSGELNLKAKIDKMVNATTDAKAVADRADAKSTQNEANITNLTGRVDDVSDEVVQARNKTGNTNTTLKQRLDASDNKLNAVEVVSNQANQKSIANETNLATLTGKFNTLEQEVIQARGGNVDLKTRLDNMVNATTTAQNTANSVKAEVNSAKGNSATLKDRIDGIATTANQANNTANANALQINAINATQAQHENRIGLLEQNNGVIQEVIDARTNANGVTKNNLKQRLDDEYNTLNGLIATNTGNIATNRNNITSVTNEVTQARNGHPNLKTRIDGIETNVQNIQGSVNTINNNVANLTTKVGSIETTIRDATGNFADLKTRLDSINQTATNAQASATNANNGVATLTNTTNDHEQRIERLERASGASVNQEVIDARGGEATLSDRLNKMTTATTQAKTVADRADAKSIQNETRINNILNSMISFRVI